LGLYKFTKGRIRACGYAFTGAVTLLKSEPSIQVQALIAIIMTVAGFYFDISRLEWIAQTFAIGLIMSAEGLNTTCEAIADFIHPEYHDRIGHIKDIAAGAVFITAITAIIVGGIIYGPKISVLF
jgi:diacylglycerol kinase (ATP)